MAYARSAGNNLCQRLEYEGAPAIKLGNTRDSERFRVEVHTRHGAPELGDRATTPYLYLVSLTLGAFFEFVFVRDLSDLLPFLVQLAPIASATLETWHETLEELAEEQEAEQQGQGE